jgi:hypothetical protein
MCRTEVRPSVHQRSTLLEGVASAIGLLDGIADDVRQRRLG